MSYYTSEEGKFILLGNWTQGAVELLNFIVKSWTNFDEGFSFDGEFTAENLCIEYYRAGKTEGKYTIWEFDDYVLSHRIKLKDENYPISLKQYKQFLKLMADDDLSFMQDAKVIGGDQNETWTYIVKYTSDGKQLIIEDTEDIKD